ncbi:MAG: glycosyltransferase family 4 protein, partial [Oscillatoriales cyanobacterium RM1_1_9]|nr:glycosyltransferase family 4 protein [Oscillatoriales cyanobacterium RM1_1_9]
QLELKKTRYVLGVGGWGLLAHSLRAMITRPGRFFQGLGLAWKVGIKSDRGLLYHLIYLAEACVLLHWLLEAGVDRLHVHFGTNSTTVAMLCRVLGGPPYSFTVHGPEEFDKPQGIALSEKIDHASFVVAISSYGKSQLFRWCPYTQWSKIQIIRCGLDELFLDYSYTPIPDAPRLVCVGRLSEQKGHLLLLEAVSQLALTGLQFKLVFVGDGQLRPQIEARIAQSGLENYIEITGWATSREVRQHILDAQILVLPSFAEGLPVVLMEALALSRPVISTYVAGIPELVEPGENGWLVPSGSVDALIKTIQVALNTPTQQLEFMGKQGREKVLKLHNIAYESARLALLFEKMSDLPSVVRSPLLEEVAVSN